MLFNFKDKKGASEHIGLVVSLAISVIIGALVYSGVMAVINGPVANGLKSSFDVSEKPKQSIVIEKNTDASDSSIVIEDFDYNSGAVVSASDFFEETENISLLNKGEGSGYSAEYDAMSDTSTFVANFHINSDLAISRLKSALSQGNLENYKITCYLEVPMFSEGNLVSYINLYSSEIEKTINGTFNDKVLSFDLSDIAHDDDLISFVKGLESFKITITEKMSTDISSAMYSIDDIKVIRK